MSTIPADLVLDGGASGVQRTENVVLHRFVGYSFHERNVLVSGGVDYDIRLFRGEDGVYLPVVADCRDVNLKI